MNMQKKLFLGISTITDGPMKYSDGLVDKQVFNNRKKYFLRLGSELTDTVLASSVHGNKIKVVSRQDSGKVIKNFDGLITKTKGIVLVVTVADCLPIYIFDNKARVIGLLHAGWRGLKKNIIENVVITMIKKFKIKTANLQVRIGPYIKSCHYRVKSDLVNKFSEYPEALKQKNHELFIDLAVVAKHQLTDLGVNKSNIKISPECTYCLKDKYYSYRRDNPKILKTMLAYIGQKD